MTAQRLARRLQVPSCVGKRRLQLRTLGLARLEPLGQPPLALEEERRVLLLCAGECVRGDAWSGRELTKQFTRFCEKVISDALFRLRASSYAGIPGGSVIISFSFLNRIRNNNIWSE